MTGSLPIYLLCGDDEFAIEEFITGIAAHPGGDPTIADINTSQLDGRTHSLDDLVKALQTLPFMLEHRLVMFAHPTSLVRHASHQKKMLDMMDQLPPTTQLILTEDHELTTYSDRKRGKIHWLERWALASSGRVVFRTFSVPQTAELTKWVLRRAEKAGGKFTPQTADALIARTGPVPRMLDQEILKLLTFVGDARPVEPGDVAHITPFTAPVPDFALINSLRAQDPSQAFGYLRRELNEKDPLMIFFSITNQFRQVLQVREILDQGGQQRDVERLLHVHPFVAQKTLEHARAFSLPRLEAIYHRLLELDAGIKTGRLESELALDLLLVELTNASR